MVSAIKAQLLYPSHRLAIDAQVFARGADQEALQPRAIGALKALYIKQANGSVERVVAGRIMLQRLSCKLLVQCFELFCPVLGIVLYVVPRLATREAGGEDYKKMKLISIPLFLWSSKLSLPFLPWYATPKQ